MENINRLMKNVSLNKEALKINVGKQYMVIDALYLSDIKNGLSEIDSKKLLPEIREKIFSYTDTPFAIYIPIDSRFDISRLKTVDYSQVVIGDTSFFSTDTGLLILIELDILVEFVRNYDYGELVDSDNEVINSGYWDLLTAKYNTQSVGLILSPGVDSGYDFDGSGVYQII